MAQSKEVAVFCSARDVLPQYQEPAQELAVLLAQNGFDMVYGGTDRGLMKVMADEFQAKGRKVIGIIIPVYQHKARINADEMIVAPTLGERKARVLDRSLAIIGLVGGIGTLDEVMEMIELKKQGKHNKPIIVLNSGGFYDGLKVQLEKMKSEDFFPEAIEDLIHFAETPRDVMDYLDSKTL